LFDSYALWNTLMCENNLTLFVDIMISDDFFNEQKWIKVDTNSRKDLPNVNKESQTIV